MVRLQPAVTSDAPLHPSAVRKPRPAPRWPSTCSSCSGGGGGASLQLPPRRWLALGTACPWRPAAAAGAAACALPSTLPAAAVLAAAAGLSLRAIRWRRLRGAAPPPQQRGARARPLTGPPPPPLHRSRAVPLSPNLHPSSGQAQQRAAQCALPQGVGHARQDVVGPARAQAEEAQCAQGEGGQNSAQAHWRRAAAHCALPNAALQHEGARGAWLYY